MPDEFAMSTACHLGDSNTALTGVFNGSSCVIRDSDDHEKEALGVERWALNPDRANIQS